MAKLRFKDLFNNRIAYAVVPGLPPIEVMVEGKCMVNTMGRLCDIFDHVKPHMVKAVRLHARYPSGVTARHTIYERYLDPSLSNIRIFSKKRQAEAYSRSGVNQKHCYTILSIEERKRGATEV